VTNRKFKIRSGEWEYMMDQNPETGELQVASSKRIGLAKKAVEYAKAEASALVGSVPLPVIETRKAACFGCDGLEVDGESWFCKNCGCPKWERSRLQVKWEMPAATCPLGKWPVGE
jgi:hypothetical protein